MRQSCGSPIGTLPRRLRQCLWVSRMRATAADFCGSRAAVERWYCRKLFLFAPRVSGSLADEQACVLVTIFWIFVRTFDKHAGLEPSGDHILGLFVGEAWTKFPYQRPSCSFLGIWSRAISEVAPVSWTPDYLGSRSPRWARQEQPTRLSSAARWLSWCAPAARRRSWRVSLNRRHSRSGTGWHSLSVTPAGATAA